jgi:hypothetical protein
MAKLSEWLRIMLGELARKQDDAARAAAEQKQRETQPAADRTVRSAAR